MLNMDMMGRLRDNRLSISGTGTAEEFDEMLPRIVEPTGLVVSPNPGGRGPSDHSNFYDRDIPVLFFYTGDHDDYHTPRDHAWTMNPEGTARIIDLAGRIGEEMLTRPDMLTFKSSTGSGTARRTGAPVRLGIMPSYTSDLETGVLIDGVSDGTSAADAGLAEGDILLRWNDTEITDGSILMQELLKPTRRVIRSRCSFDVAAMICRCPSRSRAATNLPEAPLEKGGGRRRFPSAGPSSDRLWT